MDVTQLNDEQRSAFKQFCEVVKDWQLPDSTDQYKLTWLIARNFNVAAAEKMLKKSLEWRKVNQIDELLNWTPPEVLIKYFPFGSSGRDKFGCPVHIQRVGHADMRGMLQSVSRRDFQRFQLYIGERFLRDARLYSQETGKVVMQQTAVVDMESLSLYQMSYKPVMEEGKKMTELMEANYPENLRRVFVINAPKLFTMLFAVIKPILHPLTIEKFHIYGHNAEEWKAALLKEIDADQLPAYYGGTQTDPDGNPMCATRICMGGEVPKSYYLKKEKPQPREDMTSIVVARGSKNKIEFAITVPDSIVKWEFLTIEGDIAFHVYRRSNPNESKGKISLVPSRRVDSHVFMEEGLVVCTHEGNYVLEFDNRFSYLRSKTVWYSFAVEEPIGESSISHEPKAEVENRPQAEESSKVDIAQGVKDSRKTVETQEAEESSEVEDSPKSEDAQEAEEPLNAEESAKTEDLVKVDDPQTAEESPPVEVLQMDESPVIELQVAEESSKAEDSPKVDDSEAADESPRIELQTSREFPKSEDSPKIEDPQAAEESPVVELQVTEDSPKADDPKTAEETPVIELQALEEFPKSDDLPKADDPKTAEELPLVEVIQVADESPVIELQVAEELPKVDDPQTIRESPMVGLEQANEFIKSEDLPKVEDPQAAEESPLVEVLQVADESPKAEDSPNVGEPDESPVVEQVAKEIPKTEESPKTKDSSKVEDSQTAEETPKTDVLQEAKGTPEAEDAHDAEETPKPVDLPLAKDTPKTEDAQEAEKSPKADEGVKEAQ